MDDNEAIQRCLAGDREAFRHLVERYERKALAHAQGLCVHEAAAQDCAQEAFFDAYRSLGDFDTRRPFYPWFYTMLRNRCLKHLRQKGKLREISLPSITAFATTSAQLNNPVEEALLRLDPEEREILLLKYRSSLKYREIAGQLSISLGTVMSRLYRARERLREELAREEGQDHGK